MRLFRKTYAEVNLDLLEENWKNLKNEFPDRFICPMVKANAYGHGDVTVARALQTFGARQVGVCLVEEALLLRKLGVQTDILVFRGFDQDGAEEIVRNQLVPVVSSWDQLKYLEEAAHSPISIHVKFDTGMNRLGFDPAEAQKIYDYLCSHKILKAVGVLTHFVSGEDGMQSEGMTHQQLELFLPVVKIFKPLGVHFHVLNSGAVLASSELKKAGALSSSLLGREPWGIRPGLMTYGYGPGGSDWSFDLKPIMSLRSSITALKNVKRGQGVSYNHTWKAKEDSLIAVVPIGYADGYHRRLSGKSSALVLGKRVPVVGTVCMDFLMLDVTELRHELSSSNSDRQEIEVTLLGMDESNNFISAHELAQNSATIAWEILTSIGERVPRLYKGKWAAHFENEKVNL